MNQNKKEARLYADFKEFTSLLPRLSNVEFLGVVHKFKIGYKDGEKEKDFDLLLEEVLDRFLKFSKSRRRKWIKILRECAEVED